MTVPESMRAKREHFAPSGSYTVSSNVLDLVRCSNALSASEFSDLISDGHALQRSARSSSDLVNAALHFT